MNEVDLKYFSQRELEERIAAASATEPGVHDAHFSLAERYADLLWGLGEAGYVPAPVVRR